MAPRRNKSKNPPIFSHEYVIQNHADIVSCVALFFVIGLMFQVSSPVATLFVGMQHNVTVNETTNIDYDPDIWYYSYGKKDIFAVFFYSLVCIVLHQVLQEYVLDKFNRRMHLSKVKHSKFNESGQLLAFYICSALWGIDIIIRENYIVGISRLWDNYPHFSFPFIVKFFYILQMSYWIHTFPELYFQKIKRDEMSDRVQYAVLYFVFITFGYILNFNRVTLCMIVLHYTVEFVYHVARLLYFAEKVDAANIGFMVFNVLFVLVRLGTIVLAVLTFWYGLEQSSQSKFDISAGNFNTSWIRLYCLLAICFLQAWLMWMFITFHLRKLREKSANFTAKKPRSPSKKKKVMDEDISSLPEVDQNTENGSVKQRKGKKV